MKKFKELLKKKLKYLNEILKELAIASSYAIRH